MISLRKSKGLAAIEMLIVLPVLLLLLGAIVEIGRMFIHYTTLNKALQNGARSAVSETYGTERLSAIASDDDIQHIVVYGNTMSATETTLPGLKTSDISIATTADYVTVSANYNYSPIFTTIPIIGGAFNVTMKASSIMRTSP
ncbi:TadE/TadG family type IV pilus assembly protein [Vibrio rarus]|uniref:TadE/TadG family type IV pilus assembly protein n=1 Tax=Vibrio rarus TaxID=413403 RepID=UPI0021C3614C|nr:TadE/TadG family type IV pilus assembly protein [Vibrio rarus]